MHAAPNPPDVGVPFKIDTQPHAPTKQSPK
jgi:hypothetical protein